MSYVKQTWTSGDIISTERLNYMENGIAAAGGGGNPLITFNFNGFGNSSFNLQFAIVEHDDDEYVAVRVPTGIGWDTLYQLNFVNPSGKYVFPCPMPVPQLENTYLVFAQPNVNYFSTSVDGNISQDTVTINFGSTIDAYIITGDCYIDLTALDD